MGTLLPNTDVVRVGKDGRICLLTSLPIVGTLSGMTLKEYIKAGKSDTSQLAAHLGVTEHAIHKWVYGQRTPSLKTAMEIVRLTGGEVELYTLVKADAA